ISLLRVKAAGIFFEIRGPVEARRDALRSRARSRLGTLEVKTHDGSKPESCLWAREDGRLEEQDSLGGGPWLFEDVPYELYCEGPEGLPVKINHRVPELVAG